MIPTWQYVAAWYIGWSLVLIVALIVIWRIQDK